MTIGAVKNRPAGPDDAASAGGALDARALVAAFEGPACLVTATSVVVAANAKAGPLLATLRDESQTDCLLPLGALVEQVAQSGIPADIRLTVTNPEDPAAGPQVLDTTLLPSKGTPVEVLLIAKNATLERNFIQALMASRELFRDLLRCSADFAWETDAGGRFVFVNDGGALGYSADELNGRAGESLIDCQRTLHFAPGRDTSPFMSPTPVEGVELWLTTASGTPHCFLISAIPVLDPNGKRRGSRGVCQDVTPLRQREQELAQARNRDLLSRTILDATLHERNFTDMLSTAARATGLSAQADRAWVLLAPPGNSYDVGAAFGMMPHGTRHFLPPNLAEPLLAADTTVSFSDGDWTYLGAPTRLRGARNGAICVARHISGKPFDADAFALIQLVAKHAAIAIAQASQLKQLNDLINSDQLTGIGNRRELGEIFDAWKNSGPLAKDTGAALLYIDLDDFKQVNDSAGHAAGDLLLRTFASLAKRDSRKRDRVVRLGGDEFVVWMDGMRAEALQARAERLMSAAHDIPLPAPLEPRRLSLSIGGVFVPSKADAVLETILAAADRALYTAKRQGKGRIEIAADETSRTHSGGASC